MQNPVRSEEFRKHFKKQPDAVLQEMLSRSQDYDRTAIIAAESELRSRGIDPMNIVLIPAIQNPGIKFNRKDFYKDAFRKMVYPSEFGSGSEAALDAVLINTGPKFKNWKTAAILWLIFFSLEFIGSIIVLVISGPIKLTYLMEFILILGVFICGMRILSVIMFMRKQKIGLLLFSLSLAYTASYALMPLCNTLYYWTQSDFSTSYVPAAISKLIIPVLAIFSVYKLRKGKLPTFHETTSSQLKRQVIITSLVFLFFSHFYYNVNIYLSGSPDMEKSEEVDLENYYR